MKCAVLMTDMVGSTRLWETDTDTMADVVRHLDLVIDTVASDFSGRLVKPRGEGDSFFLTFDHPADAIHCALAINQALRNEHWSNRLEVRFRSAVHYGDVEPIGGDFYGPTINRCARLRSVAHPEQILVSEAAMAMARPQLGFGLVFTDLGMHLLKDLTRPELIFQASLRECAQEFPPIHSLSGSQHRLPVQLSRFVGRSEDLKKLTRLVIENRAVSLHGLAGIGKSRLVTQAAAEVADEFKGGAKFLDVGLSSEHSLPADIGRVLGAVGINGLDFSTVRVATGDHATLLVLDHCEAVEHTAQCVHALLLAAPNLRVLAASRTPLQVPGEASFVVQPLDTGRAITGASSDSALLFLDRARLARPDFTLIESELPAFQDILGVLEGIPLSIELAAARVNLLSIPQLRDSLQQNLRVLGKGAAKHQEMIEVGIASISDSARRTLDAASVFFGSSTLESLSEVSGISNWEIIDDLDELQRQALILTHTEESPVRYSLLNAIRETTLTQISRTQLSILQEAHASHYSTMLGKLVDLKSSTDWRKVDADYPNFRAALLTLLENGSQTEALRMNVCLFRYWEARGLAVEGLELCERTLADCVEAGELEADVHNAAGCLAGRAGKHEVARREHLRCIELRQFLGDQQGMAGSLNNLANLENDLGNSKRAVKLYEEALEINQSLNNHNWAAINLVNLGVLAFRNGSFQSAIEHHRACIRQFELAGKPEVNYYPLAGIGNAHRELGQLAEAWISYQKALTLALAQQDMPWTVTILEGMAATQIRMGSLSIATELLSYCEAQRKQLRFPLSPSDSEEHAKWLEALEGEQSKEALSFHRNRGQSLDLSQVVRLISVTHVGSQPTQD